MSAAPNGYRYTTCIVVVVVVVVVGGGGGGGGGAIILWHAAVYCRCLKPLKIEM